VHPQYLVDDETALIVRLAKLWRDGVMPEDGGPLAQSAWTVAAITIVLKAWADLQAARDRKTARD
jgi:hypothetical protein